MIYGLLTVLGDAPEKDALRKVFAQCECGTVKAYRLSSLVNGNTRSCGCLRKALHTKHGMTGTPEYQAWQSMWARCTNPKATGYAYWGGRGIAVCERWKKFENFLADLGLKPTSTHRLDREKNEIGYEPSNCRWVTPLESNQNTRRSLHVEYKGEHLPLAEAANRAGLSYKVALYRHNKGIALCA